MLFKQTAASAIKLNPFTTWVCYRWFSASSRSELSATKILDLYAKRWRIETTFKDVKDY
ncbi:transposase [Vibrio crassostreae]|uniref:transposase n=1 Tax=Vibrio crassostreae TaxID=246167 RepID=UPI001B30F7EA